MAKKLQSMGKLFKGRHTIMRWVQRFVPEFEKRWNRPSSPRECQYSSWLGLSWLAWAGWRQAVQILIGDEFVRVWRWRLGQLHRGSLTNPGLAG
ncbi:MAG: hypothetical protein EOP82_24520 [Variovorax sp.]|nr:MAG: hypothetical protein EOP82_24520 [Variovorax sp.]